jgi:ankyrin repeat protein
MYIACDLNKVDMVRLLIEYPHIDVNKRNSFESNNTPLHKACNKSYKKIIELLVSHPEININAQNSSGNTPLHIICTNQFLDENNEQIELIKMFFSNPDIDINITNKEGEHIINYLVSPDKLNTLIYILSKYPSIDINTQNNSGFGLLHDAVLDLSIVTVDYLLSQPNINVNIETNKGYSPLYFLCHNLTSSINTLREIKNIELINKLLNHKSIQINFDLLEFRKNIKLYGLLKNKKNHILDKVSHILDGVQT